VEVLPATVRSTERLMLGLRLDEPVPFGEVEDAVDAAALDRLVAAGLAERRGDGLRLTDRGRFVGGGVTARLLA
jgi:coproporphyrinogen III oxidase-like Fe-S oxidoreductase